MTPVKITITLIKADIGSIGGHIRTCDVTTDVICQTIDEAHQSGLIIDYKIRNAGDDSEILMTHDRGIDNEEIHKVAFEALMKGAQNAKERGLYGAGQDILKEAFSGNVRGMGPGVAEMEFEERPAEPFVIFAADKTAPGAFNYPIFRVFADPFNTAGLIIDPKMHDGFIFEVISWIAARQDLGELALLKDPHVSATSQGIDGLMIELADDKSKVAMTTVFEDKCTGDPRETFLGKVIPAFLERHQNKRSAELVATAAVLLRMAGIDDAAAAQLSAAVMDRGRRRYRAAFALTEEYDGQNERAKLFKGYDILAGISQNQRVGASLIVSGGLREWFDAVATQAIAYLDELQAEGA